MTSPQAAESQDLEAALFPADPPAVAAAAKAKAKVAKKAKTTATATATATEAEEEKASAEKIEAAAPAASAAAEDEKVSSEKNEPAAPAEANTAAEKKAEEENLRRHSSFMQKVFYTLSLQYAVCSAISVVSAVVHPIPRFFSSPPHFVFLFIYILILVAPLVVMYIMLKHGDKDPTNLARLALFTLFLSNSIGSESSIAGTSFMRTAAPTEVFINGLKGFTFMAILKGFDMGYDLTVLFPFLYDCYHVVMVYHTYSSMYTCIRVLIIYIIIQISFRMGRVAMIIYGFLSLPVFWAMIYWDSKKLAENNEYWLFAISLYLDSLNICVSLRSIIPLREFISRMWKKKSN